MQIQIETYSEHAMSFAEYKKLDLVAVNREILEKWKNENTFRNVLKESEGAPAFIFFLDAFSQLSISCSTIRCFDGFRRLLSINSATSSYLRIHFSSCVIFLLLFGNLSQIRNDIIKSFIYLSIGTSCSYI